MLKKILVPLQWDYSTEEMEGEDGPQQLKMRSYFYKQERISTAGGTRTLKTFGLHHFK